MRWCQAQSQSAGINLPQLLGNSQTVGSHEPTSFVVRSACGHWQDCEPGDVYFAISTAECDGHDYVEEAIARGARAVVCERLLPVQIPQLLVADSRIAYGKTCQALAGQPSQRIKLVGVGGAVGKTVTSHLIHSILEKADSVCGLASSMEIRNGGSIQNRSVPTQSPAIANLVAEMCIGKCDHGVLEMSSIPLAQRAFAGIQLDAAVVTNIKRSHLALHGNLANCQQANARIFDCLKPTGFAVINADDKYSAQLLNEVNAPTLTFGIHQSAEVRAKIINRNSSFQTFVISAGSDSIVVRTAIIGKHHIYNCLAAATVALTLGIDLHVIASGLETASMAGRMERIDCGQSYGIWVDSASNPSQLNGAISALAPICEGRLWCICTTEPNQSADERKWMGQMLEQKIDKPIITQFSLHSGIDYEPCHQMLDGFSKPESAHVMPDRRKAIEWALSNAKPKDTVLIVGAGEKASGPFGKAKIQLTDRQICQAFLCKHGTQAQFLKQEIFRMEDYR